MNNRINRSSVISQNCFFVDICCGTINKCAYRSRIHHITNKTGSKESAPCLPNLFNIRCIKLQKKWTHTSTGCPIDQRTHTHPTLPWSGRPAKFTNCGSEVNNRQSLQFLSHFTVQPQQVAPRQVNRRLVEAHTTIAVQAINS